MNHSDSPDNAQKLFQRSLLRDGGWTLLSINWANQQFVDFCRYARAMEGLVDQAEKSELQLLEPKAESLAEGDREEFWAWNYPVHWDQVVRITFRASTVTAFVSFLETTITHAADDVRRITQEELKSSDLHGSQIQKCIAYLRRFGGFQIPEALTKGLDDIVQVRNVLVHANGHLDTSGRSRRIHAMIGKVPGLAEDCGRVCAGKDYIEHCLVRGQDLLSVLVEQTKQLWERRQRFSGQGS